MLRTIMAVLAVALLTLPALAEAPELQQGMKTLAVSGRITTGNGTTSIAVGGEYGIITAPQLELGPRVYVEHYSNGTDFTNWMVGGFVRWRTAVTSNSVPYFQLGVDYLFGDADDMAVISGGVGVDNFLSESTSLFIDLQAVKPLKSGYDVYLESKIGMRFFLE